MHSYGIVVDDTQLALVLLANIELATSEAWGREFRPALQTIRRAYAYNFAHTNDSLTVILRELAGADGVRKLNEAPSASTGAANAVTDQISYLTSLLHQQRVDDTETKRVLRLHLLVLLQRVGDDHLEGVRRADEVRQQPRAAPAVAPALQREIARANEVWARLNQSWPQLFDALEAATNNEVALLEVEPDSLRQTVRITAEVKRRPAMLAYIERLGQQPALGDITLLEHHVNQQDKELPIRFSLSAQWRAGS